MLFPCCFRCFRVLRGWLWLCALLLAALLPAAPARAQSPGDTADEIVYIDPSGVVRVRDYATSGRATIAWFSPQGGYTDAILLDVNHDTDLEIAALRPITGSTTLDIYDPVVALGPVAPGQSINGVPWALLASIALEAPAGVLAAGNVDTTAPGAELVLSARSAESGVGGAVEYKQSLYYLRNVGAQDGRTWEYLSLPVTRKDWSSLALGDMNADGVDEIGLVAKDPGALEVWRTTAPGLADRAFSSESDNRPWLHLDFGRVHGATMLGAVRDAPIGLPSLLIFRWANGTLVDECGGGNDFDPSPNFIFFGDINGNGDAETFMLRSVDPSNTIKPRLIMRQRCNVPSTLFEEKLDSDNGFQVGAAGDFDGDGKHELILMRPERFRDYLSPNTGVAFSETALPNNGRTLVLGDVDRIGYQAEKVLVAEPASVVQSGVAGGPRVTTGLTINATPSDARAAIAFSVQGSPAWLSVSAASLTTPAQLTLTFDPSQLEQGAFSASLRITSPDPLVLQQPLVVPVTFTVAPGLLLRPASAAFVYPACPATSAQTQGLRVIAPTGTAYTVSVLRPETDAAGDAAAPNLTWPSSVPWLSAASTGTAPETIALTANGALASANPEQARVVVVATVNGQPMARTARVTLLCANTQVRLPVVRK